MRTALLGTGRSATFDPSQLGVIGAWFDAGLASDAGAGLAFTLPNRLTANHATTIIDARKPTISTAANGVPILICNASCLQVALHAAINGATKWGIAFHGRVTTALGNPVPASIDSAGSGGASARKLLIQRSAGEGGFVFNSTSTECRSINGGTLWTTSTWGHFALEMNLASGGAEADRVLWRKDGVAVSSAFANVVGVPGAMPVAMSTPTGFMNLFAQSAVAGGNSWVGEVCNMMVFSDAMPGARCLLTDAAALSLSNFNRPT
jgi:hypothetical protein